VTAAKRRFVWLALAALALGGAVLVYPGPGRPFVRGHVGDVAATMLVYAVFGLVPWTARWSRRARAVATLVLAFAIELGQPLWSAYGKDGAGALVIGSVFDPWDLLAYVLGAIVGVWWDRASSMTTPSPR
jgi:hypothetical protein